MHIELHSISLIKNKGLLDERMLLNNVSVEFKPSCSYLISGDVGKYYIGKLIMGIIEPTEGYLKINNYILKRNSYQSNISKLRSKIAYLPYDYSDKFNYKQVNNIFKEALYNYKYKTDKADNLVENIIDKTGCYLDYKKENILNLSSIQKYKLYLASILIYDPQIIVLEKIINDDKIKSFLNDLIMEGKTVIYIGNYKMPVDKCYVINNNGIREA